MFDQLKTEPSITEVKKLARFCIESDIIRLFYILEWSQAH